MFLFGSRKAVGHCVRRPRCRTCQNTALYSLRERIAYKKMSVFVQPQRLPGDGDTIGDLPPRFNEIIQSWTFITYEFVVTAPFAGYFEWWFPWADFAGRDVRIWHATLEKSANIGNPQIARLFIQSPSEEVRCLVYDFTFKAGLEMVDCHDFVIPHTARAVLVFDAVALNTVLRVDYLIEVL